MEIGAFQAKNTLGALLDRVEEGEEIIITRHGRAIARLGPCQSHVDSDAAQRAFTRIRARAGKLAASDVGWESLKKDRDTGRP